MSCFDIWHESAPIPHPCKLTPEFSPIKGKRKSSDIQQHYENINTVAIADHTRARMDTSSYTASQQYQTFQTQTQYAYLMLKHIFIILHQGVVNSEKYTPSLKEERQ